MLVMAALMQLVRHVPVLGRARGIGLRLLRGRLMVPKVAPSGSTKTMLYKRKSLSFWLRLYVKRQD